jgi:hypothetical protein
LRRTLAAASGHVFGVLAVVNGKIPPAEALERVGCHSLKQAVACFNASLEN